MPKNLCSAKEDARRLYVEGEPWLVYEPPSLYDRREPCLVFESETVVRRVRDYPTHWRELTDAELAGVMASA